MLLVAGERGRLKVDKSRIVVVVVVVVVVSERRISWSLVRGGRLKVDKNKDWVTASWEPRLVVGRR